MGRIAEVISQVLSTIRASLSTAISAVRTVVVPVFRGGKWVYETATETYTHYVRPAAVAVARPTLAVADDALSVTAAVCRPVVNVTAAVGRPLAKSAAAVALLPATALGAVVGAFGARSAPVGKQADAAAQQAAGQVQQQAQKADKDQEIISQARLWQRVAKWKAMGRDVKHYADVMQASEIAYLQKLTLGECEALAAADVRIVADWLYGNRSGVPGVRSPSEIRAETVSRKAEPERTADEAQVLNALQSRLLARGYSKRRDASMASYRAALED